MPNSSEPSAKIKCLSSELRADGDVEIKPSNIGCDIATETSFRRGQSAVRLSIGITNRYINVSSGSGQRYAWAASCLRNTKGGPTFVDE